MSSRATWPWPAVVIAALLSWAASEARAEGLEQQLERQGRELDRFERDFHSRLAELEKFEGYRELRLERRRLQLEAWRLENEAGRSLPEHERKERLDGLDLGLQVLEQTLERLSMEGPGRAVGWARTWRNWLGEQRRVQARAKEHLALQKTLLALIEQFELREDLRERIERLEATLPGMQNEEVRRFNEQKIREAKAHLAALERRLSNAKIGVQEAYDMARSFLSRDDAREDEEVLRLYGQHVHGSSDRFAQVEARTRTLGLHVNAVIGTSIRPTVGASRGSVGKVGRDGRLAPVDSGATLKPGEGLETGEGSSATFEAGDGEAVELGPESKLTIGDEPLSLELERGSLRFRRFLGDVHRRLRPFVIKLERAAQRRHAIRTPGTVSIRGSDVLVLEDGEDLRLLVKEGSAVLATSDGESIEIERGQQVRLRDGRVVGEVEPVRADRFDREALALWR